MTARAVTLFCSLALCSCREGQRSSEVQTTAKAQEGLNCASAQMEPLTPAITKRLAEIKEAIRPVAEVAGAGANATPEQKVNLLSAMMNAGGPKGFADMAKYWVDHTPASSSQCTSLLAIESFFNDQAAKDSARQNSK